MPNFKDFLAADLATFMNPDEFAETHDIDGQQIACIVDSDILKERGQSVPGVYAGGKMLFVKTSDLEDRPVPGQYLRLDGKLYVVADCNESGGMLEITLGANEA